MKIFITLIIAFVLIGVFSKDNSIDSKEEYLDSISNNSGIELNTINIWDYIAKTDDMSSGLVQTALIESNNIINLDFPYQGGTIAKLQIRYHPRYGKDLIFSTNNGQLTCEYRNCYITLRYDNSPPIKATVTKPADHDSTTYFIDGFKKHFDLIKKSKKLNVEVMFYKQGVHTFQFNVENLDTVKLALLK